MVAPTWLYSAIAAPHALTASVLVGPATARSLAARLGHDDAQVPFAALLAVLSAAQLGAVGQWLREAPYRPGLALPLPLRLALAAPLLVGGGALKWGAARALGRGGWAFARQLAASPRERVLPAATAWPYTVLEHPDYIGSCLLLLGGGCLTLTGSVVPVGGFSLFVTWLALYAASILLDEGYACAGGPPQPPLLHGANPFLDTMSRPINGTERMRMALMAPVAALRIAIFVAFLASYCGVVLALTKLVPGDEKRKHALLVPVTQVAARVLLYLLGFTVVVTGRANVTAAQRAVAASNGVFSIVVNHLSYLDVVVVASVFGPYAAAARHDLLSWPLVGTCAKAWGVVGVVQSEVRAQELAATDPAPTAAAPPSPSATPSTPPSTPPPSVMPGGRAAILAARARLPGSGWALPPVLVFPEGTITAGGCLITFRSGAFVAGVPVLPVTLRYSTPSGFNLAWASPHTTSDHFWRAMCAWGKRVEITVLPLHTPSAEERADASLFAENVRSTMARSLGWPALTGWSVRDAHAFFKGLPVPLERPVSPVVEGPPAEHATLNVAPTPPPAPLLTRHRGGGGSGAELQPVATAAAPALTPPRASTRRGASPASKQA